jgi:hypothetical protein
MSFTEKVVKRTFCPCENCGTTIRAGRDSLCDKCMKVFYEKPLNEVKLRKCRKCSRMSSNYFYCHEHSIKDGEDNDFLNYNLRIKLNHTNTHDE